MLALLACPIQQRLSAAVVLNANTFGVGSLSNAIAIVNSSTNGTNVITFQIPASTQTLYTIRPPNPLPAITRPVLIDGYSQFFAHPNTVSGSNDAVLLIELDGSNSSSGDGLQVATSNVVIRGLIINRFKGNGIGILSGGNVIQGNFIGTDGTGTNAAANEGNGIEITGTGNLIGGINVADVNIVAFNSNGVMVASGTNNAIRGNSIFNNQILGINLGGGFSILPNDPGDGDNGPNLQQNYPLLTSAVLRNGYVSIDGSLDSTANNTFQLEFFGSGSPSCPEAGKRFLGASILDLSTSTTFTNAFQVSVALGESITALATDTNGNTSEFSPCVAVAALPPSILVPPMSQSIPVGETVSFNVSADGTPPLSYQWRFKGNELSGATDPALSVPNVQPSDAGPYTVAVTNVAGAVTSPTAILTVQTPSVTATFSNGLAHRCGFTQSLQPYTLLRGLLTVTNKASSAVRVTFYFSTNSTFESSDVPIGTALCPRNKPNGFPIKFIVRLRPKATADGNYLFALLDSTHKVTKLTNNMVVPFGQIRLTNNASP